MSLHHIETEPAASIAFPHAAVRAYQQIFHKQTIVIRGLMGFQWIAEPVRAWVSRSPGRFRQPHTSARVGRHRRRRTISLFRRCCGASARPPFDALHDCRRQMLRGRCSS